MKRVVGKTFVSLVLAGLTAQASAAVSLTKIGEYSFAVNGCGGIAYAGGNQFYILRDHNEASPSRAEVYPLALAWDATSGAITSQTLGDPFNPGSLNDSEGLAYDPGTGSLWISDEATPSITEFDMGDVFHRSLRTASVPSVQRTGKVSNRSLEALTISGDGLTMWTANEQALSVDGELSDGNTSVETVVRLTRFDRTSVRTAWTHTGQWAYKCDKCGGSTSAQSGLSGLCALPDGSVLTLEREVSVSTAGRCRVYRVTPEMISAATEITALAALKESSYVAISKGSCLREFKGGGLSTMIVYEGICLGPRLSDGSLAVYLVSDGGATKSALGGLITATTVSRLCALKLSGLDVVTVNYDTPAEGTITPSGHNYRYLKGTTLTASFACEGLTAPAYTNNGAQVGSAAWTAGASSGRGTTATVTLAGDTTFAWTIDRRTAATEIGSNDSFEGFTEGTRADEIASWSGDGAVESATYVPPTPPGYPMPRETHTRVLNAEDSSVRTLSNNIAGNRHLDFMTEVHRAQEPLAAAQEGDRVRVSVDPDGCICLWHLKNNGGTWAAGWTRISEKAYANGTWVRVELDIEDHDGSSFCRVKLDGSVCPTAAGFRAPSLTTSVGSWYRIPSETAAQMSQIEFVGTRVDDVLVTTDAFPAEHTGPTATNGIAFTWFDAAGLPRDPAAAAPNLPGKTVQYLYDSGVDPYSDLPLAITQMARDADGRIHLEFNGYKGVYPEMGYRVISSTDLKTWLPFGTSDGTFSADPSTWSSSWDGSAPSADPLPTRFFKIEAAPTTSE